MLRSLLARAVLICLLAMLPAVLLAVMHPEAPSWEEEQAGEGEIALRDARQLGDAVLWIDARAETQFVNDHIPGARSLNLDDWDAGIEDVVMSWNPSQTVIVYCDSRVCDRSHKVADRLREEYGMAPVLVLHGGWDAWLKAQ